MKTIRINNTLNERVKDLANIKGISKKKAIDYAVRLSISIEESETQLKDEIASLFSGLQGIPRDSSREIAYHIRNQSRLIRGLAIMVEMLQEDLHELRSKGNP